ncbi:hypothetical protein ECG_00950 [Echinococcus granulosus]|uniref:Amiloride sensitive cation channel 4 A n=1 Tax=Echinococcus granulosus TaxID=6210 RepID=A0A068WCK2_ECHGR|nr:hypothetical protein ECG_00950 [Echinococcus granulosus]CDS16159.1 amiloride sensitive cation channel 4 A [Echinococcus granulosus]
MRFYTRFIEGAFFLISIVVLVILLGLRFKYWKESSQGGGSGYGSILTSSDLTISKLEESPAVNVPFPFFSLCNANPARGSILFGLHAENEKSPLWYEKFLDALLARPLSLKVDDVDGVHNANFHLMLNHTAHEMKNMLVEQVASILFICANILNCMSNNRSTKRPPIITIIMCRISSRTCSHVQFVKHVLPSGVCYTFRGELKPSEKLHLELDPESVDYLIPNSGLVGFRFLIHETPEPHWVHHQSAVFLGAQFHTMLRLVGTRKVHESDCVPQRTWEACLRKCLLFRIQKECGCIFSASNDGCNLESISNCSIQLDVLQESISLSACSCIGPCDQLVYTYESITQAWQPFFLGFRRFRRFQPLHPRNAYNQSNLDEKIPRAFNRYWLNSPKQSEKDYQLSASVQLWAFLREANRNVFHELMSLDETLLSLHRLIKAMLNVVKVIGQAVNYSRGGGSHLMNSLLHAKGKKISIFDENCLDQAEQTGMLARVSQLSDAFTNRLQESFLFNTTQATVQLNLIMIFLQRSPLDFSRLLNDLRISDLISDVTVLELRRNGQKCLDAAHGVNGLLSNFTVRELFPLNSSVTRAGDVSRGNGNVISSLQAMLLATDSNLNKLNVEFSRLYDQNKVLIQEMRGLLASQLSIEQRHSRVAVTVQISSRQGLSLRLKSSESLFNKNAELLDILTSAVMIGSFLVLLAEGVFTTMWECRLRPQSQKQEDLLKHRFEHRVPRSIPSPLSSPLASLSQQQLETVVPVSTRSPKPPRGSPRYVHSLSRDQTKLPAYNVKWNHLTLAQPQKFVGQFMRQQEQQHPLFLDITESISDINTPSTFTHPLSDVV